ncbi:MAG: SGNH/GDSL hydrolase family protein [Bacillota bacterium]
MLVAGEGIARFGIGLGDPPLSIADPEIEYLFKPSMSYHRFGRHISYNAYSMRSGPITPARSDPAEVRVMVLGDSVINGGVLTDDSELTTARLQLRLRDTLQRPVYVGNISAGSWGPPNMLAYTRRFGWFDANVVVIVLSSHDYCDVPTFQPIVGVNPAFPDHAPVLALQELVARYVLPRVARLRASAENLQVTPATQKDIDTALEAIRQMVRSARAAGARVIIAQHLEAGELGGHEMPGHAAIAGVAKELDVDLVQLGPVFEQAQKAGQTVYHDKVHPTPRGQQMIADTLLPHIVAMLQPASTQAAAQRVVK